MGYGKKSGKESPNPSIISKGLAAHKNQEEKIGELALSERRRAKNKTAFAPTVPSPKLEESGTEARRHSKDISQQNLEGSIYASATEGRRGNCEVPRWTLRVGLGSPGVGQ